MVFFAISAPGVCECETGRARHVREVIRVLLKMATPIQS